MPAVQPCCQQVSAVQRCKVLPARTSSFIKFERKFCSPDDSIYLACKYQQRFCSPRTCVAKAISSDRRNLGRCFIGARASRRFTSGERCRRASGGYSKASKNAFNNSSAFGWLCCTSRVSEHFVCKTEFRFEEPEKAQ
jgi:hypothetical protein